MYLEGQPGNYNGGEGLPAGVWEGENAPHTNLTQISRHLTWIFVHLSVIVFQLLQGVGRLKCPTHQLEAFNMDFDLIIEEL